MLQSHIWDSMPSPFMSDSVQRRRIRSSLALRESQLLNTVYQVGTVDGLRALPAESVFARERRAATSLIHRWGPERRRPAIIGAVSQGDTLAFVVLLVPEWIGPDSMQTMFPMPPRRPSRAEVTTLRRMDGEWRSMMDYPGTGTMGGMTALPDSN